VVRSANGRCRVNSATSAMNGRPWTEGNPVARRAMVEGQMPRKLQSARAALVPADELDAANLKLVSFVNGEIRQDSTTADLIFGVDHLVWYLSQFAVLDPGDVINTGTPQGVSLSGRLPYLRPR
jgi:hypothetical protein